MKMVRPNLFLIPIWTLFILAMGCSKFPAHLIHPVASSDPGTIAQSQGVDLSVLSIAFSGAAQMYLGDCNVASVQIQDALGNSILAPTNTDITLSQDGGSQFYEDSACTVPTTGVRISRGLSSRALFLRPLGTPGSLLNLRAADTGGKMRTGIKQVRLLLPSSISISDGPSFTFNPTPNGGVAIKLFSISNATPNDATSLNVNSLASPFNIVSSTCGTTLASNQTCTVTVTFSPLSVASFNANLTVMYNDGLALQTTARAINAVGVGLPTKLLLTGSGNLFTSSCGGYSLTSADVAGSATPALSQIDVTLTAGGSAKFYADSTCTTQISTATFLAGMSAIPLYVKDTVPESTLITASDNNGVLANTQKSLLISSAASLTFSDGPNYDFGSIPTGNAVTKVFTVTNSGLVGANALSIPPLTAPFSFTGGSYPGTGGTCGVSLGANGSGLETCTLSVSFQSSTTGASSAMLQLIYFDGTSYQIASRAIQGAIVGNATHVGIAGTSKPIAGSCSPYTISTLDANGNSVTALNDLDITLSQNASGVFYSDSQCNPSSSITSARVLKNSLSVTVYFRDLTAEGVQVSATPIGSILPGSLALTVLTPANLVFQTGSTFNFRGVLIGSSANQSFTITNSGQVDATAISAGNISSPFAYAGGNFPGTGGTCNSILVAGASCTVVYRFSPVAASSYSSLALIPYQNGITLKIAEISLNGLGVIPTQPFQKANGFNGIVNALAMEDDGVRVYVGGAFTTYNKTQVNRLARLNADETIDATFNTGTGPNSTVQGIAPLRDGTGRIYIYGNFTKYNNVLTPGYVARILKTGSLDTTFVAPALNRIVGTADIVYRSGGNHQLYIGGGFTTLGAATVNGLARLNSDGTFDSTFNTGTGFAMGTFPVAYATVSALAVVQGTTPSLYVGGNFQTYNGSPQAALISITDNGTPDSAFNTAIGGGAPATIDGVPAVYVLALDAANNLYLSGYLFVNNPQWAASNNHLRLSPAGVPDFVFAQATNNGQNSYPMELDASGNIYIGNIYNYSGLPQPGISIVNSSGALVPNNLQQNANSNGIINCIAIAADGSFYIGGTFTAFNGQAYNRFVRFKANGTVDPATPQGSGIDSMALSGNVYSMLPLPDGSNRVYLAGDFNTFNGSSSLPRMVRMNPDTTIDNSFALGSGFNAAVNAIALDSLGQIYAVGAFTTFNGFTANRVSVLNSNGSIQSTFYSGSGFNNSLSTVLPLSDGTAFYVGGSFTAYQGSPYKYCTRLLANGNVDPAFNMGTGFDGAVTSIVSAGDGTTDVYMAGWFSNYNGVAAPHIIRLKADGSVNTSFNPGTGLNTGNVNGYPVSLNVVPGGGALYANGAFLKYQTNASAYVVRILANGNLDSSFVLAAPGIGNVVLSLTQALDGSGKIYIGGYFLAVSGNTANYAARLNQNGSFDPTFVMGTGFDYLVYSIMMSPDLSGAVYFGGALSSYNLQTTGHVVRLTNTGTLN